MKISAGVVAAFFLVALPFGSSALHAQTEAPTQTQTDGQVSDVNVQTGSTAAPRIAAASGESAPGSGVRIVRLSQIKGEAQMDRNTGSGYEAAFTNLPVVQGAKLKTAQGVAEVEFEDNSTLRLTPETVVEFAQLKRSTDGATVSAIRVIKGTIYVSLAKTKVNQFTVRFGADATGADKLTLAPSSHIEFSVANPATRLAVFDGSVQVEDASGVTTVGKKKSLVFDPAGKASPTLVANVEKGPFDDWDKSSVDYHKRVANVSAFGAGSTSLYGINDLNYYGSFSNIAGCGSVWRPYFASAAWDPYANGTWAWYPGAGYSWVSPYPWGWAPFHSGDWQLCGSGGWGWRPGGQWNGLVNHPKPSTVGPTHLRPPLPPIPGHPTLVPVNVHPVAISTLTSSNTFVFRNDSAGLGIPRQGFGRLNKISAGVVQHGTVSAPVAVTTGVVPSRTPVPANAGNSVANRTFADDPGSNHPAHNSLAGSAAVQSQSRSSNSSPSAARGTSSGGSSPAAPSSRGTGYSGSSVSSGNSSGGFHSSSPSPSAPAPSSPASSGSSGHH